MQPLFRLIIPWIINCIHNKEYLHETDEMYLNTILENGNYNDI